jgi:hypothetical protein
MVSQEWSHNMKAPNPFKMATTATAILLAAFSLTVLASAPAKAEAGKTYFTGEETGLSQVPGQLLADGSDVYMLNRELVAREEITDPRLDGMGYFKYTVAANIIKMRCCGYARAT